MAKKEQFVNVNGDTIILEQEQRRVREEAISVFKEYRRSIGATQTQISQISGISQPNIARFESGEYNPSLGFMVRIAASMGKRVKLTFED